jgi:hypothetical protein
LQLVVHLKKEKNPIIYDIPLTTVMVCGQNDVPYNTSGSKEPPLIINTTSRSKERWSTGLSPFFVGPVNLYNSNKAKNLENAWQYCKVYKEHVDENNDPTEEYFKWAKQGWENDKPMRFPMGRGAKPQYSLWDGKKLDYIDARKQIYAPLYAEAVVKTKAFKRLESIYNDPNRNQCIWLFDFDGYSYVQENITLYDTLHDDTRPMGHAFVLASLLMNQKNWEN